MEKLKFSECEVQSYLEDKIMDNTATEDEQNLYQNFLLFGKLHKMNHTWQGLVNQMRELFETIF
jgi:hypothetical protein